MITILLISVISLGIFCVVLLIMLLGLKYRVNKERNTFKQELSSKLTATVTSKGLEVASSEGAIFIKTTKLLK